VLIGVGQSSERIGDKAYRGLSTVELAVAATRVALADTGVDVAAAAAALDVVGATRQFENSAPGMKAPFGASTNFPRSVASGVGADPERAVLDVAGGQSPQSLVSEFAAEIAAGHATCVLLVGAEAMSTVRELRSTGAKPDWSDDPAGDLEDRGYGITGLMTRQGIMHGLVDAPSQYALFENARRAARGESRAAYSESMGALFAPFTRVAEGNPHAVAQRRLDPDDLIRIDDVNRIIVDPYPRYLVSRDLVNQGAAVVIASIATAEKLGVPQSKWVFLHGHADLREQDLFDRQDLSAAPSAVSAVRHALDVARIELKDVNWFDLYNCFPIAVSNVLDGLGLEPHDERGFTLTGGLPFFGGPGNNYSMHAIAEAVERARKDSGTFGLVGANGGMLSKYSVGIYSTVPAPWRPDGSALLQAEIAARATVEVAEVPDGLARIETYTVKHRSNTRTVVVIGRLEADGRRFIAKGVDGDSEFLDFLENQDQPIGSSVFVRGHASANRVALSEARMNELMPRRAIGFRDSYEFVEVTRNGHILEIVLNRPEVRNALHPPAHEELEEIFDAYFADPNLWVSIVTGAGTKAFCAGNDLAYGATGAPVYIPNSGFGGLTSRASLPKPVIAAVNGSAMGGGFEIVLACHLAVADQTASFALSEVKVGLIAAAGGLVRLPRRVPAAVANELVLTGRKLPAEEAMSLGLVNRVAPPGQVMAAARELASEIVAGSPTSVRLSLKTMEQTRGFADEARAVVAPATAIDELIVSEDMLEGMTAFIEKRPPAWKNR
jgi:acetyl-CoA C-acetyltransferase